jgi:LuxR family maltose regulon positive regulatory protein
LELLSAGQPPPVEAVLTGLINELDAGAVEVALALDDYQVIHNPAVHAALNFLIEHLPAAFYPPGSGQLSQ